MLDRPTIEPERPLIEPQQVVEAKFMRSCRASRIRFQIEPIEFAHSAILATIV